MEEYKIVDEHQILLSLWNEIEVDKRNSLLSDFVTHNRNLVLFSDISILIAKKTRQKSSQINSLPSNKYISKLIDVLGLNKIEIITLFKYLIEKYCDKYLKHIKNDFLTTQDAFFENFGISSSEKKILCSNVLPDQSIKEVNCITENENGFDIEKLSSKILNAKLNTTIELLKNYDEKEIRFLYKYFVTVEFEYFSKNTSKILKMNFDEIKVMKELDPNDILSVDDRLFKMKIKFESFSKFLEDNIVANLKKNTLPDIVMPDLFDVLIKEFNELKLNIVETATKLNIEIDGKETINSLGQLEKIQSEIKVLEYNAEDMNQLIVYYDKFKQLTYNSGDKIDFIIKFKNSLEEKTSELERNKGNKQFLKFELLKIENFDYEYNLLLRLINESNVSKEVISKCMKFFGKDLIYAGIEGDLIFQDSSKIEVDSKSNEHCKKESDYSKSELKNIENRSSIIQNDTAQEITNAESDNEENKKSIDQSVKELNSLEQIPGIDTILFSTDESNLNDNISAKIAEDEISKVELEEIHSDLNPVSIDETICSIEGVTEYEQKLLDSAITNLLKNNVSTSYILLNFLNESNENIKKAWPDWILKALAFSQFLCDENDDFSIELKNLIKTNQELKYNILSPTYKTGINLILLSSLIKPSIVAPATGAGDILHYIKFSDNFNFLNNFCYEIQNFSLLNYPISREVITYLNGNGNVKSEFEILKDEILVWKKQVSHTKFNFIPAEDLLRKWLEKDGFITKIINPIIENDKNQKDYIESLLKDISTDYDIHKEIDRAIKKLNIMNDTVSGIARDKLTSRINNVKRFYDRWIDILNRKVVKIDFKFTKVEEFYSKLNNSIKEIKVKLSEFSDKNTELIVQAGIKSLTRSFDNINEYFKGNVFQKDFSLNPREILLINTYSINIHKDKEHQYDHIKRKKFVSDTLVNVKDNIDWDQVVASLCESGDIKTFNKIYAYFQFIDPDNTLLKKWDKQKDKSIQEHTDKLFRKKEYVRNEVECSVMNMLLSGSEREEFNSKISEKIKENYIDFISEYKKLKKIENELIERKNLQRDNFKLRLNEINLSDEFRKRILKCIENNEIATASILMDAAERGDERNFALENTDDLNDFLNSFEPINKFLASYDNDKSKLIETIEKNEIGSPLGPINLPNSEIDFSNSIEILKHWFEIKNNKVDFDDKKLRQLIKWLGWEDASITTENPLSKNAKVFTITFTNIPYCPLPTFGSDTSGKIKFFCIWSSGNDYNLISSLRLIKNQKIIIFYFGRLSHQNRAEMLNLSIKEKSTFIIIDDTIFSYLTTITSFKLRSLYRITFPFTYVKPYVTAASVLPKEMFFGRKKILEGLYNPHGPCIIYGGRQLGKTVILKKLEKEYNKINEDIYVTYFDLKQKGLGEINKETSHIWSMLGESLHNSKIIEKRSKITTFKNANINILNFLNNHPGSRILCLFDEADKFIEIDSENNFPVLTELNGLMRDTDGNFKFVLSGLHSVNKFSKISNSPISHLLSRGSVCVGPMIDNGEQREARNLIVKPFSIMGFRFESEEVISQMLSLSNFYPSLIQLFCDKLINELHEQLENRPSDLYPPIVIKKENVENVYFKKRKLREEIVERFEWTLNLDPRYEVIAYIIALKSIETEHFIGLSNSKIKEFAENWKKEIFSKSGSIDEYSDILDEMVSLGILRKSEKSLYLIKNSNVIKLLGTKEQIESKLLNISERKLPEQFPAYNYRSYSNDIPSKFSPLVHSQEGKLFEFSNKVLLFLGSGALCIDNVSEFIKDACENSNVEYFMNSKNLSVYEVQRKIDEFISKDIDRKSLLLFDSINIPEKNILKRAIDSLNEKKSIKFFKKIVFVSHSDSLWSYLRHENEYIKSLTETKGFEIIYLRKLKETFIENLFKHNMINLEISNCINDFGLWPSFYNSLIGNDRRFKERYKEELAHLTDEKMKNELINLFGINNDEILSVLNLISDMDFNSIDDFKDIADNSDHFELFETVINWGKMSEIFDFENGRYSLDPIILNLLKH